MIANGSLQRGRAHRKKNPGDGDILYGSLFRGSGWAAGGGFFTFLIISINFTDFTGFGEI